VLPHRGSFTGAPQPPIIDRVTDDTDLDVFPARLVRARSGDPEAFAELVAWLERPLRGYLRGRSVWDPDDLANEVLARAFAGIGDFEGDGVQFRAWVYRIARNLAVDEARARSRRPDARATDPALLPESACDATVEAPSEDLSRVHELLAELTDDQRDVVLLRAVVGLGVDETARVLGRGTGAVRSMQHRALRRLRRKFSAEP